MQIGGDSILLASGHSGVGSWPPHQQMNAPPQLPYSQQLYARGHGQNMAPLLSPRGMLPATYVTPALTPMLPPSMGMQQPYQMPHPQMWPAAPLQSYAPQYAMPAAQMSAQLPLSQATSVNASAPTAPLPMPARISLTGTGTPVTSPNQTGEAGMDQSPNTQGCPSSVSSGAHTSSPKQSTPVEGIEGNAASAAPGMQQLARQLAVQHIEEGAQHSSPL
jgi:hypothetical protein